MKKSLLFATSAFAAAAVFAATPVTLPEFYTMAISRDGKYIASVLSELVDVYDTESGQVRTYEGVMTGNGNCFANDGTIVGSTTNDAPVFLKDGNIITPANLTGYHLCDFHGITADGSRICGLVDAPEGNTDGQMYQPAIFNVSADGTVSDPVLLPHPEYDYIGLRPQYCSAVFISDDGKTVLGQVKDDSGMMIYPILYREGADGKWTYSLPTASLLNPDNLELPEYPGEFEVTPPDPVDFMSDEAKARYEEAYRQWEESGYTTEYPEPADYLTPEEIVEYNKATDAYNALAAEWNEKYEKFMAAREAIYSSSVGFVQNGFAMNADGTLAAAASSKNVDTGSYFPEEVNTTYILDLKNGTFREVDPENKHLIPGQVLADGQVLASTPAPGPMSGVLTPPVTFILLPGGNDYMPIESYLETSNPEIVTWMNENLYHNIPVGVDEDYNEIYDNVLMTGHMVASDDFSVISGGVFAYYFSDDMSFMSYVFKGVTNAAERIEAGSSSLRALRGGVLDVKGEVSAVSVFDLSGRRVFSANETSGRVNTHLPAGIYAVSYTDAEGIRHNVKVAF